jgi:hypothetical protein
MTREQVLRSIPKQRGRKMLTFEEVVASQRPAVFEDFGDSLFYLRGEVFVMRGADPQAPPPVLDLSRLTHAVGIETGWRHPRSCDCEFCSPGAREQAA